MRGGAARGGPSLISDSITALRVHNLPYSRHENRPAGKPEPGPRSDRAGSRGTRHGDLRALSAALWLYRAGLLGIARGVAFDRARAGARGERHRRVPAPQRRPVRTDLQRDRGRAARLHVRAPGGEGRATRPDVRKNAALRTEKWGQSPFFALRLFR